MARKGWESLTPNYRKRLESKGITRTDYEAGVSLTAARRGNTPEHPQRYNPQKYPEYHARRTALMQKVADRKRQLWGDSPRWDDQRSEQHIRQKPITNKMLTWFLKASEEDLVDAIRQSSDTFYFIGYH